MGVTLAVIYHDPQARLYDLMGQTLPTLTGIFDGVAVEANPAVPEKSLARLTQAGARVERRPPEPARGFPPIGRYRRAVLDLALQMGAAWIMYCDGDQAFHWAAHHPQELAQVAGRLPEQDFTVLGRTPRAFATRPRIQRDTERIVNQVFAAISGRAWDVTAAARGLSARAAQALVAGCPEDSLGVDAAWPLFLQRRGGFSLGYLEVDGLEFETPDRYGKEVAAAGGLAQWRAQLDADPRRWAHRLNLARIEVEAMIPYADG